MSRIIIENRTDMSDAEAVSRVAQVIAQGRASGSGDKKQYTYLTVFADDVMVSAFKNKASDRLVVHL